MMAVFIRPFLIVQAQTMPPGRMSKPRPQTRHQAPITTPTPRTATATSAAQTWGLHPHAAPPYPAPWERETPAWPTLILPKRFARHTM